MSTQIPPVDHNTQYIKYECLVLTLSHYHAEFQQHTANPDEVPSTNVPKIAKLYSLNEATLYCHIGNPGQTTQAKDASNKQVLTVEKENVLVKRLSFLDDFNILASKATFYTFAYNILY